jgi:hypothetical protein
LWPKFAGIRRLALASLDGTDLVKASKHRIICTLEASDIGTTDQRDNFQGQSNRIAWHQH